MYARLALKNLLGQKMRSIITSLGICIGIASLVLLLALSNGLKKAIFQNLTSGSPLTQITVQPKGQAGSFLRLMQPGGGTSSSLSAENLKDVKKIPHVKAVYPEMIYSSISSLQVFAFGQGLQTDMMISGVPYEFIADDLQPPNIRSSWEKPTEPYPVIISRKIVDLYNLTIARANNLPTFKEQDLVGREMMILPNESTFFPQLGKAGKILSAEIAGFSDRTSLIGVTMPIEIVRKLNLEKNPEYKDSYMRLFVEIENAEYVEEVQKAVEALGLESFSPFEQIKIIEENFKIVTVGLSLISFIILLVSGLMIANTFLSAARERKREIGIFRAVGATRRDIQKIFLVEATLMGFAGGVAGVVTGLLASLILNGFVLQALPDYSSKPATLFVHDPLALFGVVIFAVILSALFAYLPATTASKLKPLEAMTS